ncbi:hypothetical protein SLE2022_265830 [Rubroshorea leprosula]
MPALQRSTTSFRRQGSLGLVWHDNLLSGELQKLKLNNEESDAVMRRSRSEGGCTRPMPLGLERPSPRLSICGFSGTSAKHALAAKKTKSNNSGPN